MIINLIINSLKFIVTITSKKWVEKVIISTIVIKPCIDGVNLCQAWVNSKLLLVYCRHTTVKMSRWLHSCATGHLCTWLIVVGLKMMILAASVILLTFSTIVVRLVDSRCFRAGVFSRSVDFCDQLSLFVFHCTEIFILIRATFLVINRMINH